ncbi:efflux RND transporter periplasmic adaptor subunit [Endozoicomonas sp.]|uniref:efflux RND transporter periplasmic adaptor subunit n=1 Tax=Endozoicomonas sp. TaxID=1892382 RepID=UPI00383B87DB
MQAPQKRLFFFALGAGVLIFVLAVLNRQSPPLNPATDRAVPVRATALERKAIAPLISGFGRVQPKIEWKAVAETSGKVIYRHPDLEKGRILKAGETLLNIDPQDYQLQLARARAELNASKAQLAKLNLEEKNLQASLKIEEQRLTLVEKELTRKEQLLNKNVLSQSDIDQQRLSFLAQQSQVLNLKNQLNLVPDNRSASEAQVKVNQSTVAEAQRLLSKTTITLPFTARVASVDFEVGEAVNQQQQLAMLHGISTMEVEAQVPLHEIKTLLNSITFSAARQNDYSQLSPEQFNLNAHIIFSSGNYRAERAARVVRISETIDPNQGTVGVILEIEQDVKNMLNRHQVPLANGLFVEAIIEGLPHPQLLVPEAALHGNTLYLLDDQNKLQTTSVNVLFRRDGIAVIESVIESVIGSVIESAIDADIQPGRMVITTDVVPAIEGMQLKLVTEPFTKETGATP